MSRQAGMCSGLGFVRVLLCVPIAAVAVRLELNAADARAGNTAAPPVASGRDTDVRPRMPVLATCLSRSHIPPDKRLDRLVTPFAIAENPAKHEGYQGETDAFMHEWGAGIRVRPNGLPAMEFATKPIAGSITATKDGDGKSFLDQRHLRQKEDGVSACDNWSRQLLPAGTIAILRTWIRDAQLSAECRTFGLPMSCLAIPQSASGSSGLSPVRQHP